MFNPALPGMFISTEIETRLIQSSMLLLSDEEVRVRIAAGDLLGALGRKLGISVYEDSKGIELTSNNILLHPYMPNTKEFKYYLCLMLLNF